MQQDAQGQSSVEREDTGTPPASVASTSSINKIHQPVIKKRKVEGSISKQNELLSLACTYLTKSSKETKDCDYLDIGKVWSQKLKELQPRQRLFAEKAINDILFEAQLGTLNKNSIKINCDSNFTYSTLYSSSSDITNSPTPTPPPPTFPTTPPAFIQQIPTQDDNASNIIFVTSYNNDT